MSKARRKRGRGIRPWLIQLKLLGLVGCFGGLAALIAIGCLADRPVDAAGWDLLRGIMRAIFWPCFFGGLVTTILAGILLWLQHPRVFLTRHWFRLKLGLLVVVVPSLHMWARARVIAFYDGIDRGELDELGGYLDRVTTGWAVTFVVLFAIATIGRVKPRLRQGYGSRHEDEA